MTLTTTTNRAVSVPFYGLLQTYQIPALRSDLYDEILVSISAAARQHEMYVVINVQEEMDCRLSAAAEEDCPEEILYIFNTNVVFDRTGAVIDRYRKIHLFGEFPRTPALKPDLGVFTTDFGVTFGHLICFDLHFQVPAIQLVQKYNLTNIIFSIMWYSELPYLSAVQIQESYAYAMNVNFLASGANNVFAGSAGSGIYSGKAGALISLMPGLPTNHLLVSRVPKTPGQVNFPVPGPIYDNPSDHDNLDIWVDPSLPAHVSRALVPGFQEFTLIDKNVSCKFSVHMNQRAGEPNYKYRAAVFDGVRTFSGLVTAGTRICSVFACVADDISSCGQRFTTYQANATAAFEKLTIEATVPTPAVVSELETHDSTYFPVSLNVNIMPLEPSDTTYTVTDQGRTTTYTFSLTNFNTELYSFAVWGRAYETDGREEDGAVDGDYSVVDEDDSAEPEENDALDLTDSSFVHIVSPCLLVSVVTSVFSTRFI